MAWRRGALRVMIVIPLTITITGGGCTEKSKSWLARNKKAKGPPIAMQPVTLEGAPVSDSAEGASASDSPTAQSTDQAQTENNSEKVLAYLERLPAETAGPADGAPVNEQPPIQTPAARPVSPSAEPPAAVAASANAPVSIGGPAANQEQVKRPARRAQAAPTIEAVRIKTSSATDVVGSDARTLRTNEPLDATASAREMSVSGYLASLEEDLKQSPADVEAQWRLSALRLAMGEDAKALELSREIGQEPAGVLKGALEIMVGARKMLSDPVQPADPLLAQLDGLRERLSGQAELEIPVVALCTRVMTFGVYDEMPVDQLVPYQANRAIVYSEIKNFASRAGGEGQFETMLSGRLELLTKDGRSVWRHEEPQIKDVSKQRRGDFFLAQLVSLPPSLAPGDYVLKVTIEDQLAGKANEGRLEFAVKGTELTRK